MCTQIRMVSDLRVVGLISIVFGAIIFTYYESPPPIDPYIRDSQSYTPTICRNLIRNLIDLFNYLPNLHACMKEHEILKSHDLGPNFFALFSLFGMYLFVYHYVRDRGPSITV